MNSYIIYMDDIAIEFYNNKGDMDILLLAKVHYDIYNKLEEFNNLAISSLIDNLENTLLSIDI
jgi:hypothetical protein